MNLITLVTAALLAAFCNAAQALGGIADLTIFDRRRAVSQEAAGAACRSRATVEASPVRYTSFERASSQPAETVVIYYDSYRNLVARGVIPRAPQAPHYPNPFPGFVPDPPA